MLSELAEHMISHSAAEQRVSRATIDGWRSVLRRYCRQQTDFTVAAIHAFLDDLEDRRPRTRRSILYALKTFGDWLVSTGHRADNPAATIPRPKLDRARRDVCSDDELLDLLTAALRVPPARRGAMASAIAHVLAYGGLRRSELLALELRDVDLRYGTIEVRHGKGDKPRTIVVNDVCRQALGAWLQFRGSCRHPMLWGDEHRQLGDDGLRKLLDDVRYAAGHADNRGLLPHGIRHNYGTRIMQASDLRTAQEALGHSDIRTTETYLHTSEERLRMAAELSTLETRRSPAETTGEARRERKRLYSHHTRSGRIRVPANGGRDAVHASVRGSRALLGGDVPAVEHGVVPR